MNTKIQFEIVDFDVETPCGLGQYIFILKSKSNTGHKYFKYLKENLGILDDGDGEFIDVISDIDLLRNTKSISDIGYSNKLELLDYLNSKVDEYVKDYELPPILYDFTIENESRIKYLFSLITKEFSPILPSTHYTKMQIDVKLTNSNTCIIKNGCIEREYSLKMEFPKIYESFIKDANKAFIRQGGK